MTSFVEGSEEWKKWHKVLVDFPELTLDMLVVSGKKKAMREKI